MSILNRAFNFSAGPSMLPFDVIEEAAKDLIDYRGCGQSILEISHRTPEFKNIMEEAESDFRELLSIPKHYKVIFLQGGGTLQFSMVPVNLMGPNKKADYVITGTWSKKAAEEATKFGDVRIVASSEDENFSYIPKLTRQDFRRDADYVHITCNNTIYGTRYSYIPDTAGVTLVGDMSSNLLSEKIDVSKYGLIFAGAQKNIAPSGVAMVIVREDLLGKPDRNSIPTYFDYKIHADNGSLYNTPNCFGVYLAGKVFQKLKRMGGIGEIEAFNKAKAEKLYKCIDESDLFKCAVKNQEDRSLMNIVFVTGSHELDTKFVAEAKAQGLVNLGGHSSVGGMRASIYNAMPMEGVEALIKFMKKFEVDNK